MEGEEKKKENEGEEAPAEEPPPEEPPPPPEEPPPPPEEPPPHPEEPPNVQPSSRSLKTVQPSAEERTSSPEGRSTTKGFGKASPSEKQLVPSIRSYFKSNTDVDSQPAERTGRANKYTSDDRVGGGGVGGDGGGVNIPGLGNVNCAFLQKRSPYIHNPPQPEERRPRIPNPRTPREYIINLREDLADFQESHGLPRTRDYSFLSLGLALAYETARALCSLFLMFAELFPIVAIISLLMRFALDKLIDILETTEPVAKVKKSIIFVLQMLVIIIPLWIFIGTIIIPLLSLVLAIFKRMIRFKGRGRKCPSRSRPVSKPASKPASKPTCALDYFRFL